MIATKFAIRRFSISEQDLAESADLPSVGSERHKTQAENMRVAGHSMRLLPGCLAPSFTETTDFQASANRRASVKDRSS